MKDFQSSELLSPARRIVEHYAHELKIPEREVVERIILDWMARDKAEIDTFDRSRKIYLEFAVIKDDPDLRKIFDILYKKYQVGCEQGKRKDFEKHLKIHLDNGIDPTGLYEQYGYPMPGEGK